MGYIELCIHTKVRDASISITRCACGKARKDELLGGYFTRGVSSSGDAVACADQPRVIAFGKNTCARERAYVLRSAAWVRSCDDTWADDLIPRRSGDSVL